MIEKIIYIESVDPMDFYGVNNDNIEKLRKHFPKIRMIARGNELKIIGNKEDIISFEEKLNLILEHFVRFNALSETSIETLLSHDNESIKELNKNHEDTILFGNNGKAIRPRSLNQKLMVDSVDCNDLIISIGPAGTGKTYLAVALAVKALKSKEVRRIILCRPAVEAEEHLGFLPGDMKEKLDPYLQPLYDALNDMIPAKRLQDMMRDGIIQIAPLAFMRGRTLGNAFVILDEAQNATINQLKMFLTRMGENAKFIVTGDITQIDLPRKSESGLIHSRKILAGIDGIHIVEFEQKDIVRHRLVKLIVAAYDKDQR